MAVQWRAALLCACAIVVHRTLVEWSEPALIGGSSVGVRGPIGFGMDFRAWDAWHLLGPAFNNTWAFSSDGGRTWSAQQGAAARGRSIRATIQTNWYRLRWMGRHRRCAPAVCPGRAAPDARNMHTAPYCVVSKLLQTAIFVPNLGRESVAGELRVTIQLLLLREPRARPIIE